MKLRKKASDAGSDKLVLLLSMNSAISFYFVFENILFCFKLKPEKMTKIIMEIFFFDLCHLIRQTLTSKPIVSGYNHIAFV
jgi:hypothetical protein